MITSVTQHRTQIYLPAHLYQKTKRIARRQNKSIAEVVRIAIDQFDDGEKEIKKMSFIAAKDEFMKLAGMFKGPKNMAVNHDDYW